MSWLITLLVAVVGYFIVKGLHARHLARCANDDRTAEHVPETVTNNNSQADFHSNTANSASFNKAPLPAPHEGPSLLYAERSNKVSSTEDKTAASTEHTSTNRTRSQQSDVGNRGHHTSEQPQLAHQGANTSVAANASTISNTVNNEADNALDLTAETATLRSDEVGDPANSSDYTRIDTPTQQTAQQAPADHHVAATTHAPSTIQNNEGNVSDTRGQSTNNANVAIGAGATAVAAAVIAGASDSASASAHHGASAQASAGHSGAAQLSANQSLGADASAAGAQNLQTEHNDIDLELGDTTHTDADDLADDHDELLDFGDLTADISEMLKELNLRETDSPRLEIEPDEFAQLKTGEPGEVKPEKIENVAGKLRNMLQ